MSGRLVYSTDRGWTCPRCGRGRDRCKCPEPGVRERARPASAAAAPRDGVVRVRRETKGRGGKCVTTVSGVPGGERALRELASELKRRFGCGGSVAGDTIELQGDRGDAVLAELAARGLRGKLASG